MIALKNLLLTQIGVINIRNLSMCITSAIMLVIGAMLLPLSHEHSYKFSLILIQTEVISIRNLRMRTT